MIDLYQSVFQDIRTPERTEFAAKLVEILYESGYDSELDEIIVLVSTHDSLEEIIRPLESIIARSLHSLLLKMGVDIDVVSIDQNYQDVYLLLITILESIEHFDDHESMLAIVDSGEPSNIVLSNLVTFIHAKGITALPEIIQGVEDRLIRVVRSVLVGRGMVDYDEYTLDMGAALRVAHFIKLYPDNYVSEILDDNGYALPEETLVTTVDLDPETTDSYEEAIALTAAGIIVAKHEEYDDAYEAIEGIVDQLLDADFTDKKLLVCDAAHTAIKPIYATLEEVEVEEGEVENHLE